MKKRLLTYPIVAAFAFAVSHWIAVTDTDEFDGCVTYKFARVGDILRNAGEVHRYIDSDVLGRIPVGESLVSDLSKEIRGNIWFESFMPANGLDSWGNPYRVICGQRDGHPWLGFFSTGADGVSESKGNDPDDINSWGQDGDEHYRKIFIRDERIRYIKETSLFFLLLAPLCALIYERAARTPASKKRASEQPGAGQPATRPVDKPEGRIKPQPEAESPRP